MWLQLMFVMIDAIEASKGYTKLQFMINMVVAFEYDFIGVLSAYTEMRSWQRQFGTPNVS